MSNTSVHNRKKASSRTEALSAEERLARLENLAHWMDSRWTIPGTSIPVGLDAVLGLLPGIGDSLTAFISAWVLKEAHEMRLPFHLKLHMMWNIMVDWFVGLIPLLGDILDVGWKANRKNVEIIRKHIKHPYAGKRTH